MATFRLRQTGDVDVEFHGELLAHVSSQRAASDRWTEINIYRTHSGQYVTEQIGNSRHGDEHELITIHVVATAWEARESLRRTDQQYLTNLAVRALELAGEGDPAIAEIAVTRLT